MKLPHDAYSKRILALKAAILAPTLSILKTSLENNIIPVAIDFRDDVAILSAAVCIFLFDLAFNVAAPKANDFNVTRRIKRIDRDIVKLENCQNDGGDAALLKKIKAKIAALKSEKVSLISS